jgi:hypothetical protein
MDRLLDEFLADWNSRVEGAPQLILDETYPSLGVVDLLLMPLYGKKELTGPDRALLQILSRYIGRVFESLEFDRDFSEEELHRILSEPRERLELSKDKYRHNPPWQGSWLGPYLSSLIFSESADLEQRLKKVALSTVKFFTRVSPGEALTQFGELYLSGGVYPPLYIDERFPAERSSLAIYLELKALGASAERILAFARCLLDSPDEQLALTGVALYAALIQVAPDQTVCSRVERFGRYLSLLRPAMVQIRAEFEAEPDWIFAEQFNSGRFRIETLLGMHPLLIFTEGFLSKHWGELKLRKLVQALSLFDIDAAFDLSAQLIELDPTLYEVSLQRVYLLNISQRSADADALVRALLSEPQLEGDPTLFSLWAMSAPEPETIRKRLSVAYSAATIGHPRRALICNDFAWVLIKLGEPEAALGILQEAGREPNSSLLTVALNEALAFQALGDETARGQALKRALSLSPLDRRVVSACFF